MAQHARTREQFGRPIGACRAVARPRAGMPVRAETARAAVHVAPATVPRYAEAWASPGRRTFIRTSNASGYGPDVPEGARRVMGCSLSNRSPEPPAPSPAFDVVDRSARMSRIVASGYHGALRPGCVLRVTRHGPESAVRSGTLCGMRVVVSTRRTGVASEASPERPVPATVRRATGPTDTACSTCRGGRRTVCRTGTPSRWNMPEALVDVTVRQPCWPIRDSRSVTLVQAVVQATQRMATIVALVRRESKCPPVRMV
ncbi:hypothetical protein ACFP51_26135 [Streptomyces pratens]|uniref:Uncharacterized protein n=1 Tax=Streptomyces pratens TaxID=887456 RepID=A0ABW1LZB5_9ACTN